MQIKTSSSYKFIMVIFILSAIFLSLYPKIAQAKISKAEATQALLELYTRQEQPKKLISLCKKSGRDLLERQTCLNAMASLAIRLYNEKKYSQALLLYKNLLSYNPDNAGILYQLGHMYHNGLGTAQSFAKAIYWYNLALSKLKCNNYTRVSILNDEGAAYEGLLNYVSAFNYYKQAAQMGLAYSQMNLGRMYYWGRGTLQNYKQAYAWLSVATAQGLHESGTQVRVEKLKNDISFILTLQDKSGASLREAKKLAQQYYNKYVLHKKPKVKKNHKFGSKMKTMFDKFAS